MYNVPRKCGGGAAVGAGGNRVHDTTLATLDEQSERQVGPKNLFDRPARDPQSSSIKFPPWGGLGDSHARALLAAMLSLFLICDKGANL